MPYVKINGEQQYLLDKHEFERLVSERSKISAEIEALKAVRFVENVFFTGRLSLEISSREQKIKSIDLALADHRKKLGIETPTIHTEL
ncbi:MAG: hypothetical protein WCT49_00330 [Candidatus Paceibacterota bacterium]|jgi:hypothetical protein|nr:hypothetical protein [Candidatus Paceibacterota bacterium]